MIPSLQCFGWDGPGGTEESLADRVWADVVADARRWAEDASVRPLLKTRIFRFAGLGAALAEALGERLGLEPAARRLLRGALAERGLLYEEDWEDGRRTVVDLVARDLVSVKERDPACENLAHAFLFFKGFMAVRTQGRASGRGPPARPPRAEVFADTRLPAPTAAQIAAHRVAHALWRRSRVQALMLQSRASEVFAVDIHPLARIGPALVIDHAHGVVIGETATIGEDVTMLHGVTLGATGKERGDRHPKIGNNVLIGAHVCVLGAIHIGDRAKIGAGALVLRSLPEGVTAVGVPAKVVGITREQEPSKELDHAMRHVTSKFGLRSFSFDSLWREIDADEDGKLSANEVTAQLTSMGLSKELADRCYVKLDSNLDGFVDQDEFRQNWPAVLRSVCPDHELCVGHTWELRRQPVQVK